MANTSDKPISIRELQLCLGDKEFFYLFDNLSVFNSSPRQRQMNMIASISDVHKLLRYAQKPKFYKICKAPELLQHWQKLLEQNKENGRETDANPENKQEASFKLNRHLFDELLLRHCKEMYELAAGENNLALANEYKKLGISYSKMDREIPSQEQILRLSL